MASRALASVRMGANGDKGLDGVGQGIHAGGGGNGWRNVEHHAGVVDGDIRIRFGSIITSFTCRSLSIITALLVISAAVPAVVLMATSGTPAFFTLPTPE